MAIVPETEFVGKINAADANYDLGSARDVVTDDDGTGTPWKARLINDIWGLNQKLLNVAGITPSGSPDTILASDYFDALMTLVSRPTLTVATMTALTGVRAGNVFNVAERSTDNGGGAIWVAITTGSTPGVDLPDTARIVVGVADPLISFVLRTGSKLFISQWLSGVDADLVLPIMDTFSAGKLAIVIDKAVTAPTLTTIASKVDFVGLGAIANTLTLTFSREVNESIYNRLEIFNSTGDIVLAGKTRKIYPEWFGIFNEDDGNDGTVDLDSNTRRCGRCHGDSKGCLIWGFGKYFIRDYLLDASDMLMFGQGMDKTFLENSIVNNVSTRLGNVLAIYAPTAALSPLIGNRDWTGDVNTENCHMADFTVIFDDTKTVSQDPTMNNVAILGVNGASAKNIKSILSTGNRAFFVGTNYPNQKTLNVTVSRCKSEGAITGGFISEGFDSNTGKQLKGIVFKENDFKVRRVASDATGGPSSAFFMHGGDTTANSDVGIVSLIDNRGSGGAIGIHTSGAGATTRFHSKLVAKNTYLTDFSEQGIQSNIEDAEFLNTELDLEALVTITVQAAGFKLNIGANGGALRNTIRGTKFTNISGTGNIRSIDISPIAGMSHTIDDNDFIYENAITPQFDIFFLDSVGVTGDVILTNNAFNDTGVANVRGTTVNNEALYHDNGGNSGMKLFNLQTYLSRATAPVDKRYYETGTRLQFTAPLFTANTQVSWICTALHTPLAAGTWKVGFG